ncbi:MAG: dihydropteroate synthase [Pseudomonadota bacterium]
MNEDVSPAFEPFLWRLGHGRTLELGRKSQIMGVLNVTPDSFSDGGKFHVPDDAKRQAENMVAEGAAIIDVGGESTRPGAEPISAQQELDRVLPVIEFLNQSLDCAISIDSYRFETAQEAVTHGAHVINDVFGLQRDQRLAELAAEHKSGLCVMHTGRNREVLPDPIEDQIAYLTRSMEIASQAGVSRQAIVLDPGFGFAKENNEINLDLLARLDRLHVLGQPIMVGTSRKRFIGALTGREPRDRDVGTAATNVMARLKGAGLFRVHNVAVTRDAMLMADAVVEQTISNGLNDEANQQQGDTQ